MFLSNINLGQYVPTGSIIHKLDPRAKLFSLIFIIFILDYRAWSCR